jgi:hypothetical protein
VIREGVEADAKEEKAAIKIAQTKVQSSTICRAVLFIISICLNSIE